MAFNAIAKMELTAGGRTVGGQKTYSGDSRISHNLSIPTATTDQVVECAFTMAQVKALIISSDQDITVETNASDHAGGNILAIKANVPYMETTDTYQTSELTEDVTALYITNTSGATANINIEVIYDGTA